MKKIYEEKNILPLPIYDLDGNLLWPRKMDYEEIKNEREISSKTINVNEFYEK
jgi:hypothetical protein